MSLILLESFDDGLYGSRAQQISGATTTTGRTGLALHAGGAGFAVIRWTFPTADRHATYIVGFGYRANTLASHTILQLKADNNTTTHITLSSNSVGALTVSGHGSSDSGTLTEDVWHFVELYVTLSDTVGVVKLRVDGATPSGWTDVTNGDTKSGGTATVFDSVFMQCDNSGASNIDDVYVCTGAGSVNNDVLGDTKVETLFPNGNGNYSQLTGSDGNSVDNYLLVDESPTPSASDYVGHATTGNKDTYAFGDLATTSGTVYGVMVSSYAAKSDTGLKKARAVARRSAVDATGDDKVLQTSYAPHDQVWELDPTDSSTWTIANVNASEFGFEVRP